jgi:HSP20 family molecular chaperone IbpA
MSTISLWARRDPFAEVDAVVRRAFGTYAAPRSLRAAAFSPAAEIAKDGDDAVLRVELPGLDAANDVNVDVDRGRLVIHGERRDERTEDQNGRSLREVRYGSFRRSFALPSHVTADAVTASYDAGVLSVRVAGAYASSGAQRVAITSGASAAPAVEGVAADTDTAGTDQADAA